MSTESDRQWFEWHDNLVTLVRYMANHGHDVHEVADAVEKPWKYIDVYNEAEAELAAELDAEAAARDQAEVDEALAPPSADEPCPVLGGEHEWEPDDDGVTSHRMLRSGMGLHCIECGAQTVYDRGGEG